MAWPTPKVSIAFDDGPYVASPTWTDITSYVYSADVSRGRSDDYSQFIGTAQVVLNNNSRLFDPFFTSGTYFGKLLPRRQIKIEGISNSVTYPVFRGFVDGFPASWDQAGKFATTTLSCFDGLSLLSAELLPDYVYDYTTSLSPVHYWRCNDGQGNTTLTDEIGGRTMSAKSGTNNYATGSQLSQSLNSSSVTFTSYETTEVTSPLASSAAISVSGFIYPTIVSDTIGYKFIEIMGRKDNVGPGAKQYIRLQRDPGANYFFALATGDASGTSSRSTNTADEVGLYNTPFFFTITLNPTTGAMNLYYNGQAQTGTALTGSTSNNNIFPISQARWNYLGVQELSLYNKILTAAEALQLYQYNANNVLETSAVRIGRLLDYTPWDATLRSITTTPVATLSAIGSPNSNIVAEMQIVADTEDSDLFVTRAGVIKFTDRNYVYTNTSSNTSQATFASGSIPFEPSVQINYDAASLRNNITVSFSGGGQTSTTNTASVTAYGTNAMNTGTQLSTQAQAVTLAAYQATVNGQLLTNISPVSVGVTAATSDWSTLLQLELLDRYTLTVQPPTGNSISQAELINRIEHRIVPGQWQMTVDGSARYSSWFILDKSVLDGTDLLQ